MSILKAERLLRRAAQGPAVRRASIPAAAIATDDAIAVVAPGRGRFRVALSDDIAADRARLKRARAALISRGATSDIDCALLTRHFHIFPLTLVGDAAKSRDTAVVAQVRSRLSYPLSESVIDYHELPASVQRQGDDGANVLVYAVHRPIVDAILDRFLGAGWTVARLVSPGAGLASLGARDDRSLLVASTPSLLALSVIQDHSVLMERIVPWGIDRLVGLVAERLDLPDGVARRLLAGDVGEADLIATTRTVREILGNAYRDIVQEATACLGYCTSALKAQRTADIRLVGPIASAPGFAAILRREIGAERIETWDADSAGIGLGDDLRAEALRLAFRDDEVGT